ncbi:D-alanyl-D-alanine carboxypeptidase family protein [Streptomyces sp. NPDC050560]|uniref:D-alanyl-D-alanine carboxypeptidase family protein n=1 Tax=Streptomyces sp. NPDC050560 TaxID=3365630 RepID=UPI0037A5EE06
MAIRSSLLPHTARRTARTGVPALALAAGLALLGPVPLAAAGPGEPAPPAPRPEPPHGLLDGSGTRANPRAQDARPPDDISALSWLVADAHSGEVLAAHDAHRALPPASTLKSLFALTALPRLKPDSVHRVTASDLSGVGEGSSLVGVETGHRYRVDDLWRGVFLSSGNDAVHVLGSMIGGDEATVRQMREKAKKLGARDTRVVSPDGYDHPGQVSSAYDLAVFGRAGLADPDFARYCSTAVAKFPGDEGPYAIQNTNRLLTGADGLGRYRGVLGVKNGYTTNAGNTLIAAAHRGGRTLLVTLMHPTSGEPNAVYREARSLLDWGFASADRVRPVGTLAPGTAATPPPAQAGAVHASAADGDGAFGPFGPGLLAAAGCGALLVSWGAALAVRRRARRGRGA